MSWTGTPTQGSQDLRVPDIFVTLEESCSRTVDPVLDVGWSIASSLPYRLVTPDHVNFPPGAFKGGKMLAQSDYNGIQNNVRNMHCHHP